jgi:wobble nucleotide-excising tRNase
MRIKLAVEEEDLRAEIRELESEAQEDREEIECLDRRVNELEEAISNFLFARGTRKDLLRVLRADRLIPVL